MGMLEERQLRIAAILADFYVRQSEFMTEEAIKMREERTETLRKRTLLDERMDAMMDTMICRRASPWRRK
jgi:hypothetical protein